VQQRSNDVLALARAPGVRTLNVGVSTIARNVDVSTIEQNVGVSTYQQSVGASTIEQISASRQLHLLALSNVPRETKKFLFV